MKKWGFSLAVVFVFFLVAAKGVSANEGVIRLAGKGDADGRCFAVSIFVDGNYKLLMTCRGLQMALDPVLNKYVVWANVGETRHRLGEIVNGKLSAVIGDKFDSLFVTLEADAYATKPSSNLVLSGRVEAIDFGKGSFNSSVVVPTTPTASPASNAESVAPAGRQLGGQARNLTGAVVAIGKAILLGFILLLIIVGVMSFLARRKNL